ncbi:MAG TPA: SNF2-related protein [Candidatus Margulisiibacteriota bacterium]|nr:SNF2-related protein [Candidatus Margulisiibacteriota bacterium]
MEAAFIVGQLVRLRADPSKAGPVIEILPAVRGMERYRVFHGRSEVRDYYADQLEGAEPPRADALLTAIAEHRGVDAEVFRARLTASRLARPQVDNLYALHAARIKYVPFQFKPLLRFLRADQPRLLIADEVGVGKTIEAGLILKELQTRQEMGTVLIVCPKDLVEKWRMEMRRFDEDFRPLTAETLRYCLREAHLDGVWPAQYARAIAHLELLRMDEYLTGTSGRRSRPSLLSLNPAPHFDLVIVDEAHHLRNPETNSHTLASFLCEVSEAVLFLSATPVHVGSRNLFTLLNLLRPDLFPDQAVFDQLVEPSPLLTKAMRHIRTRAPHDGWQREAAGALDAAARTSWGRQVLAQDPRFIEWQQNLGPDVPALSDADRIRCLRDLEEVHSLAHVMNRTRRRDIGRFTIREPRTVSVAFTAEQQRFYDELIAFRRDVLSLNYDPRVIALVTDTLQRQAASCLPALVPALDAFLKTGRFSTAILTDTTEEEDDEHNLPPELIDRARRLRNMAVALPPDDPKLDQLLTIVRSALATDGPGKVLVFSFFLHTLGYLDAKLRAHGYRVAVVSGRVQDEERERLRERFRLPRTDPDALDVLLSSEVGCEGLDYEFCDQLVNYDIPWNPMRVEQRIGRIDRFGQRSEKVQIFNFITPGTVEERIFFRCYERLGVFRDTIGDLEEVLGDVVQDLTRVALDPALTPQQAEEKARQAADNAIRLIEEQRRMEEEGGTLLGLDQAFVEEVDALVAEGRFVSTNDLRQMIERFVEEPAFGGKLTPDDRHPGLFRLRLNKDARMGLAERVRALKRQDRPTASFTRWLGGDDPFLSLAFEQEAALEDRDVPFVTPVHPLARIAIAHWTTAREPLVSCLAVRDDQLPEGRYLFVCDLWEAIAAKPELRLVTLAWNMDTSRVASEVSLSLLRLFSLAEALPSSTAPTAEILELGLRQLEEEAHRLYLEARTRLCETNETLVVRKLASLDGYYRNRLQRVQAEQSATSDSRIARMKEAERARIERDYDQKRKAVESRRDADIVSQRVAAGILEIRRGE